MRYIQGMHIYCNPGIGEVGVGGVIACGTTGLNAISKVAKRQWTTHKVVAAVAVLR